MGYCYDYRGRMVCDSCGNSGGVRKRRCPHKVQEAGPNGLHSAVSYCYAPALCTPCYKKEGGLRGVHGDRCKNGAAQMQAEAEAKQEAIDSGEAFVQAAWGQWHDTVPMGMVGLLYGGKEGQVYILVPAERYEFGVAYKFGNRPVLSELADVMQEWPGHPGSTTKEVSFIR